MFGKAFGQRITAGLGAGLVPREGRVRVLFQRDTPAVPTPKRSATSGMVSPCSFMTESSFFRNAAGYAIRSFLAG